MDGVLNDLVENLNKHQLEIIFEYNKLEVPGFRLKGPMNKLKLQKMQTTLINHQKLEELFKKAIDKYKLNSKVDYTWALASEINNEEIKQKVEETNIGEVAFALIDCNKSYLLKEILYDQNQQNENVILDKNESKKMDEQEELKEIIKVLRESLRKVESENKRVTTLLQTEKEISANFKKENEKLKLKNNELKSSVKKTNEYCGELKIKLDNSLKLLVLNENEIINIKKNTNKKILIYWASVYKKFIEKLTEEIENFEYDYVYDIDLLESYKNHRKLIILNFTLNKTESQELSKNKAFQNFNALYDVIGISSKEQMEDYIKKVRENIWVSENTGILNL